MSLIFGTYRLYPDQIQQSLYTALDNNILHYDTASIYKNEKLVANTIDQYINTHKQHSNNNNTIYITSKIKPNDLHTVNDVYNACNESLSNIKLYNTNNVHYSILLHWPSPNKINHNNITKQQMNQYRYNAYNTLIQYMYNNDNNQYKLDSIGVSNYNIEHVQSLLYDIQTHNDNDNDDDNGNGNSINIDVNNNNIISYNQIELHPLIYQTQLSLIQYCLEHNITIQAYSALGRGNSELLCNPTLINISEQYNRTVSEILVRWSLQHRFMPIIKSTNIQHIQRYNNNEINSFTLDDTTMYEIDNIENIYGKHRFCWDPTYIT